MKKIILTSALIFGFAVASQASTIFVVDNEGNTDASTGGDTTAGLVGSFTSGALQFQTTDAASDYWGATNAGFLDVSTATWTVTGYTIGQDVEVFAHWREIGQVNNASDAPYSVNGGTAVIGDQTASPAADLTLNDGADDLSFESLGIFAADASGQIQVVLSVGNNFTNVDAIAFQTVPEPSSAALLLGLAGIALVARRRK